MAMAVAQDETRQSAARPRVVLADDHVRVLASAKEVPGTTCRVVATVRDGRMALEAAQELHPDLVVLDIAMPEMDGIRTAQELRRTGSKAKIIFLTIYEDEAYIASARTWGNGYVLKSRMHSDLRHAVEEAMAGHFFVSPRCPESEQ